MERFSNAIGITRLNNSARYSLTRAHMSGLSMLANTVSASAWIALGKTGCLPNNR
jgi:hypothetical protein